MQLNTGVERKAKYGEITNMETSQEGIALIKHYEGCRLESYQCSAGVWTIGYGSTKNVKEGMSISSEKAEKLLINDIQVFEKEIKKLVTVPLIQNQFDAIVSWTFNLGSSNLKTSTMLKVLNNGVYEAVPEQIKRWNKVGGVVNDGLVKRRKSEALLFEGKDWTQI